MRIAVLPVENLSAQAVPLKEMRQFLAERSAIGSVSVLADDELETFMARHRIRYTGGLDTETARAFKVENGVDMVLITSVKQYDESLPPRIGIISRLVSTDDPPVILWIESVSIAGDDSPGLLGLGLIENPLVLRTTAMTRLMNSLAAYLAGGTAERSGKRGQARFQPKLLFRSGPLPIGRDVKVAVAPFFNSSERKFAGEIMVLHLVKELADRGQFTVIEPGVMRQKLLNFRIIMNQGISLSDEDLIAQSLDTDFIFTGEVMDYQDDQSTRGQPKVDFFSMIIDRKTKKMIWASESYNKGNDRVFFFDYGRINTASALASEMTRSLVDAMIRK